MAGTRYFSNELFEFLRDLMENNNRPWFQSNKDRYERHVKQAALGFIEDFAPHLRKISPHFVADPRPSLIASNGSSVSIVMMAGKRAMSRARRSVRAGVEGVSRIFQSGWKALKCSGTSGPR